MGQDVGDRAVSSAARGGAFPFLLPGELERPDPLSSDDLEDVLERDHGWVATLDDRAESW